MEMLLEYIQRITPGLILLTLTWLALPKKPVISKLFILIFGFILMRDAMTPAGFWEFGAAGGMVWLRFIDDALILTILALTSLAVTLFILLINKRLNAYLLWWGKNKAISLVIGLIGAVIVTAPFLIMYMEVPIGERGGAVPAGLLLPLLVFALFGNFLEEVLFRGYIQGYFEKVTGPWRAALISGLLFAAGHIFLAATVTDLGAIILLFTLYEGLVCAFVRMKHGIIASALTHGLGIFILASGII